MTHPCPDAGGGVDRSDAGVVELHEEFICKKKNIHKFVIEIFILSCL